MCVEVVGYSTTVVVVVAEGVYIDFQTLENVVDMDCMQDVVRMVGHVVDHHHGSNLQNVQHYFQIVCFCLPVTSKQSQQYSSHYFPAVAGED